MSPANGNPNTNAHLNLNIVRKNSKFKQISKLLKILLSSFSHVAFQLRPIIFSQCLLFEFHSMLGLCIAAMFFFLYLVFTAFGPLIYVYPISWALDGRLFFSGFTVFSLLSSSLRNTCVLSFDDWRENHVSRLWL